jgi:hypothetical protein
MKKAASVAFFFLHVALKEKRGAQ